MKPFVPFQALLRIGSWPSERRNETLRSVFDTRAGTYCIGELADGAYVNSEDLPATSAAVKPRTFECHVTIDPVFGEQRAQAERFAQTTGFKLAKLYMQKDALAPALPSEKDTFMTGHSNDYNTLFAAARILIEILRCNGFNVRRMKIEEILFDTKYGDEMP